ncbi:hypothetical protein [Arachidicoccus sp.]|uniref:hypothetical protein n=1 Tax=Arachidicoccus sp. TaxID=1872624 RepID=UPI003D1F4ED5
MKLQMEILLDDQAVDSISAIPASLEKHFWPYLHSYFSYEDPRVDILFQHASIGDFGYLVIHFYVRKKVKITFRQGSPMMFLLTNLGPSLKCDVGDMPNQEFSNSCFNIFHLPNFSISLYPEANEKHYELMLLEIKDIKSLLDITNEKGADSLKNMFSKMQQKRDT